jgi:hypothetical protein
VQFLCVCVGGVVSPHLPLGCCHIISARHHHCRLTNLVVCGIPVIVLYAFIHNSTSHLRKQKLNRATSPRAHPQFHKPFKKTKTQPGHWWLPPTRGPTCLGRGLTHVMEIRDGVVRWGGRHNTTMRVIEASSPHRPQKGLWGAMTGIRQWKVV